MPARKDPSGHRTLEMKFELPGTPEQVWQAIATGAGISAWFVPSEVEEHEGGAVKFHLGPGMDCAGVVTSWQPPHRFAYEEPNWSGAAPPLATEFIIEARSGSHCTVRLVHSLFTSDEQWDDQIDSMENGWPAFFAVLRVYLAHFAGMRSVAIRPTGNHAGSQADAWQKLTHALNLAGAAAGQRRSAAGTDAPPLAGVVDSVEQAERQNMLLLVLDEPGPGVALLGTYDWAGNVQVPISMYLYGDAAAANAARHGPLWEAWMNKHFPRREGAGSPC
jgi:uncharacterized protein YndB with AHSA1/START domain